MSESDIISCFRSKCSLWGSICWCADTSFYYSHSLFSLIYYYLAALKSFFTIIWHLNDLAETMFHNNTSHSLLCCAWMCAFLNIYHSDRTILDRIKNFKCHINGRAVVPEPFRVCVNVPHNVRGPATVACAQPNKC